MKPDDVRNMMRRRYLEEYEKELHLLEIELRDMFAHFPKEMKRKQRLRRIGKEKYIRHKKILKRIEQIVHARKVLQMIILQDSK